MLPSLRMFRGDLRNKGNQCIVCRIQRNNQTRLRNAIRRGPSGVFFLLDLRNRAGIKALETRSYLPYIHQGIDSFGRR